MVCCLDLDPSDQDYEWPVCLRIEAETEAAARAWGDFHSERRSRRYFPSEPFLYSRIEEINPNTRPPIFRNLNPEMSHESLPILRDGEEASDGELGW
jgi:hypothetical protein